MKALALALCLLATPALAGSITITVQPGGLTKTYTLPDAQVARLLAVMKARYGQIASGPADPITGIVPMRDRTNAEVFQAWIGGFMQGTVDAVQADEREAARKAVADPVPINPQ